MKPPLLCRLPSGFTLVEILIAAVIGAAVITAGVVGFGIIANLSSETGTTNVGLSGSAVSDLYGSTSSFVSLGPAPNYFQAVQARLLKDRLVKDASAGTAVFCLGRNFRGSPSSRPLALAVGEDTPDFRTITTPTDFRNAFEEQLGDFPSDQNGALSWATNASIFVLGTLTYNRTVDNSLKVIAVYEVDFLPTSQPAGGTFASVRRFSDTNNIVPTDYYHAYYPGEANTGNGFRPLSVFFPRAAAGGGAFAVATNHPFSFVWWPDPLNSRLEGAAVPSSTDGVPGSYANMGGRTGLFFVLPTFPPL
jgi:prepilin-type N-terminal cleavage/methylation domain-containing protein